MVRDGGMPPLMIEPIDFAALYRAKAMEMQQPRPGNPGQLRSEPHARSISPLPSSRDKIGMGRLLRRQARRQRRGLGRTRAIFATGNRPCRGRQQKTLLPSADQFEIDLGRQLRVEQGAMLLARR